VDGPSPMKPICVLLAITHTLLSCLCSDVRCTEAEVDWLQTDSYRNTIWSYRNNMKVNEEDACNQTLKDDNIIEFSNETDTKICEDKQWIYKWHVSVNDSNVYDVNVTIISLNLDESAGNYLIISPGPSLVEDEASVVITGKIQNPKMFRVVDHGEMTILMVIPENITNVTWMENNFRLSYEGIMREPDTTTPEHTSTTPAPSEDRDITVYVEELNNIEFSSARFQEAVFNMTVAYCKETSIKPCNLTGKEIVGLKEISVCPVTWPNWRRCRSITMTVEVWPNPYELTRTSLEYMWKKHADIHLPDIDLQVSPGPDNDIIFHIWLPISLAVLVIFTLLLVALWHFDIFNTKKKKDSQLSEDQRISNLSSKTWVSNSSYQEVPPMTDISYDDIYIKPRENSEITTSTNTLSVSHEKPTTSSDQFSAAYHFQRQVYDNPSFDHSSERHHSTKADYHDDPSSDDDSSATRSMDTKSHQDHLHTAPQEVTNDYNKHESAV